LKAKLSVVIVAHDSAPDLARTLPALAAELEPGDEVIVVDNDSGDRLADVIAEALPAASVLAMGTNAGFAAAVNRGAAIATGDLLLVLNPDAKPEPGFGAAIRAPLETGSSWAGGHGLPAAPDAAPREVPAASGAALAVPLEVWRRCGGFPGEFFLYQEDTDLSLRLRSAGGSVGIVPEAVVDHDYAFAGGSRKWFWLERNRWAMVIRNYPTGLLVLLAPVLLMTEVALLAAAAGGGWLPEKVRSWVAVLRWLPRLAAERRTIRASRSISSREFAEILTPELDSPFLPAAVRHPAIRAGLRLYWRCVKALLR
jgi:GT2 family glycosyltransferase